MTKTTLIYFFLISKLCRLKMVLIWLIFCQCIKVVY